MSVGVERAVLAWTEAVTRIAESRVPDEAYEAAKKYFTDKQFVNLTLAITQINAWNRFNVAFRNVAGSYQPNVRELKKKCIVNLRSPSGVQVLACDQTAVSVWLIENLRKD